VVISVLWYSNLQRHSVLTIGYDPTPPILGCSVRSTVVKCVTLIGVPNAVGFP